MPNYYIPDPRWEMPELLTPGKKPTGQVEIDWSKQDTRGLVYFAMPDLHSIDLVNGKTSDQSGCLNVGSTTGQHLKQDATTDLQWYVNNIHQTVLDDVTIIVGSAIDSMASFGSLLSVPFRDDATWANPYFSLALHRNGTTTQGRFSFAALSTLQYSDSDNGFYSIDGTFHQYALTRSGTVVKFYKDDSQFGANKSIASAAAVNFNDNAPIHLGERNHLTTGEGTTGTFKYAAVFNRILTEIEIASFYTNPYQFLIPK